MLTGYASREAKRGNIGARFGRRLEEKVMEGSSRGVSCGQEEVGGTRHRNSDLIKIQCRFVARK